MKTPGVSIREIEAQLQEPLRFDVAGLVGLAQKGPLNLPQPVAGWDQFRTVFGEPGEFSFLPYAAFGFFANGGRLCYVVRVAHPSSAKACLQIDVPKPKSEPLPLIRVEAIDEGAWANSLLVSLEPESGQELILTEVSEPGNQGDSLEENQLKLKSADGLEVDDQITLAYRSRRIRLQVKKVAGRVLTFETKENLHSRFPPGSKLLGKGIKLVLDYQPPRGKGRREVFDNLSMNPQHESYFVQAVNGNPEQEGYLDRAALGNSILARLTDLRQPGAVAPRPPRILARKLRGGADGPRRFGTHNKGEAPNGFRHYTGYDSRRGFFNPRGQGASGLAALEAVSDVCLVAIPDLILEAYPEAAKEPILRRSVTNSENLEAFEAAQREMLWHCSKLGTRFALLDPPPGLDPASRQNNIGDWPGRFRLNPSAQYGALYYPWIRHRPSDFGGRRFLIPPSGHIAGVYARTELLRGVGKSPANEVLQGVVDFEFCLDDAQQSELNPKGVNCLRFFPGRGMRVWGARTLSRQPMHRYVNIRRLTLALIKAILVRLLWTVFEPNDRRLWNKIESFLRLFLRNQFQSGNLAGSTAEEAYFVKCDEETNPPESVDLGRTITRIGFAPALPAEFILVTIERTPEAITAREASGF